MIHTDITCESRYKVDRKKIREVVEKTLGEEGVGGEVEVGVRIVGERKMAGLHQKYLEEVGVTDVLSFPLEGVVYPDGILRLGDIVVCFPVAVRQAQVGGVRVDEEIAGLVEHGCQHLLGKHHE